VLSEAWFDAQQITGPAFRPGHFSPLRRPCLSDAAKICGPVGERLKIEYMYGSAKVSPSATTTYSIACAGIFPNAQVGFTELGTANPENGSAFEQNEISTYYPMQAGVGGLPANYFGGYFWWYFAEEYKVVTPWINAAVGGGSVTESVSVTLSASPASISRRMLQAAPPIRGDCACVR
jgi:hypothetical protein